jgi:hypothetical protein
VSAIDDLVRDLERETGETASVGVGMPGAYVLLVITHVSMSI